MKLTVTDVHLGPYEFDTDDIDILVCDIDGTIADLTHRRQWVATNPKNWPAFEKTMHLDTPIYPIVHILQDMISNKDMDIIMCSGRGTQNREVTCRWLNLYGVPYSSLYMRARGDYRRDDIVKSELLDCIIEDYGHPDLIFDDRNQVVDMWRSRGYPCVQVAEGDF